MHSPLPRLAGVALAVLVLVSPALLSAAESNPRERLRFDDGWRFALGHASDPARDFNHGTGYFSYLAKTGFGDGPASPAFDDRAWRTVKLPHDWAVELPFDPRGKASHGFKALGLGFPEHNIGWYRRTFAIPATDAGRRIRLDFDGVYRAARVFVNGFFVGEEPSGYLGASYDISDYLNYGGDNVVAVRVDASQEEGWFYEGAGIYRHVWLVKTNPLHVAPDGIFVRSAVAAGASSATLDVETSVTNDGRSEATYTIDQEILGPDGKRVAQSRSIVTTLPAGTGGTRHDLLRVSQPQLWSLEAPVLHRLVTTIRVADQVVDRLETSFGVRTVTFDPDRGFFLNGQRVELRGTNNHQDHAGVGAALPDALQEFRLRRLKEMGANAYRASHNPPTPELLEACDRLGVLVIDENRLMGTSAHHLGQLERLIRRDRNHPSVILWSIGNEEWAIEGRPKGAVITVPMQDLAHRLDPTRRVTAAISGGWGGISRAIEAAGVNYVKQADIDRQHAEFPAQIILGTEETTTQATRGIYVDDRARAYLSPQEDGSSGGNAESGLQYYAARPWAAGVFYWTGFDYRGEPTPFGWPATGTQFGILDQCGFPKDGFYYLQAWWTEKTVLHLFPHWNWPGREGQAIDVRVHSNCDEVELALNGVSLGRQRMTSRGHLAWSVPYAPGTLAARGFRAGREVATAQVETTGAPAAIALVPDRTALAGDGRDVTVLAVVVRDAAGHTVPTANLPVTFAIHGPARIIGVGNGDPASHEPDQFFSALRVVRIGTWEAPDGSIKTGRNVFEVTFDAPVLAAGETASLLLDALGTDQSVTFNGELLFAHADPAKARAEIALDAKNLRATGNTLRVEATRYEDWGMRDSVKQVWPALIRIAAPAPTWTRTTFNGLAQVIIQTSGEPGTVAVEASSPGLESGASSLASQ